MSDAVKDAQARIEEIQETAKKSSNELRFVRTMKPGDIVRQGDVYVAMVEGAPSSHMIEDNPSSRQVAVGSTVGARHIAVEGVVEEKEVPSSPGGKDSKLKVFKTKMGGPLQGPFIEASGRWTLAHPEHANIVFPAGWFEVRYQPDEVTGRAVYD